MSKYFLLLSISHVRKRNKRNYKEGKLRNQIWTFFPKTYLVQKTLHMILYNCYLTGDCYLREWSEWSLCQLTCVNGEDLGFGGIQVRSRAVIIQELENQHLCPEQALETRPCNGKHQNIHHATSCKKEIQNNNSFTFFLFMVSNLGKYGFDRHGSALKFLFSRYQL